MNNKMFVDCHDTKQAARHYESVNRHWGKQSNLLAVIRWIDKHGDTDIPEGFVRSLPWYRKTRP